jgi:hypothetical protein
MYSPKIAEDLIPCLYRKAKERRMPMTSLVNRMLRDALAADRPPVPAENNPHRTSPSVKAAV